jgi:hypothetical protein
MTDRQEDSQTKHSFNEEKNKEKRIVEETTYIDPFGPRRRRLPVAHRCSS